MVYDSKREAEFARGLDLRLKAQGPDRIKSWERQIKIPLFVNGVIVGKYICDFEITHLDGSKELIEVKGRWTPLSRFKRKVFEANYPDRKYTVV